MFWLQMRSGQRAEFLCLIKYTRENNYATYMLKQLFTSMSVKSEDIYLAALRLFRCCRFTYYVIVEIGV